MMRETVAVILLAQAKAMVEIEAKLAKLEQENEAIRQQVALMLEHAR